MNTQLWVFCNKGETRPLNYAVRDFRNSASLVIHSIKGFQMSIIRGTISGLIRKLPITVVVSVVYEQTHVTCVPEQAPGEILI